MQTERDHFYPWQGVTLSAFATAAMIGVALIGWPLAGFAFEGYLPPPEEIGLMAMVGIIVAVLSAPAVWLSLAVIGVPVHFGLQKMGFTGLWHYAAAGQIAGLLCAASLYVAAAPDPAGGVGILAVYMYAGLGGISAALAWHFARSRPTDTPAV